MANFNLPYITEKRYLSIAPMLLTANGNSDGLITVASTYRIKVGQILTFKSTSVSVKLAKVKRVLSSTQFMVIDPKDSVTTINKLDMSMLLVVDTATVELSQDKRPVIELLEIQRQVYEEEPTVALRTHLVDWLGRSYDKTNPVPVELSDGSISIGTVNAELEVQLSHQDNIPDVGDVHDSVRIGDGTHTLEINSDGSINITDNGGSLTVDGIVNIGNLPATQNVAIVSSVELEIKNDTGNPVPVSGTVTANQGGTWNINNVTGTVSLPTGAATSALQTTGNTSLSSIDTKTPTLGQNIMTGSSPVVIASDQSVIPINDNGGSLTVDGAVTVSNFPATQNVAVTSIVEVEVKNDVGNPLPISSSDVTASGTIAAITQNVAVSTIGKSVVDIQVTGVYTGALTPQITVDGTNWIALSTIRNVNTNAIAATIASATQGIFQAEISGSTQFRIIALAAVTGTATITLRTSLAKGPGSSVTQAVSAASLPLPTGAATSALQTTGNTSLATIVTNTNGMSVAQGSATAGQVGRLTQAAVTTAAPTYTNGQTSPLSLNTSGGLRVDGSSVTQPISGSVTVSNFPATQNVAVTSIVEVEVKNDSGNSLPVSGTVAISSLPEVEIKNDSGNPVPISGTITANQGTTPWVVTGSMSLGGTASDAFGRVRTSNPFTLFDSSFRYGDNVYKWNHAIVGAGSVAHLSNESTMALSVTSVGDEVLRETKKVFSYQPGKSLLILSTFAMAPGKDLLQEIGYGGASDGIFFRRDSDINYFVKRTSTSGSPVETIIPQSEWNQSELPSLDPTKTQIFWMDIEWLGVGSVRCGFVIDGIFVHCHTFHHANSLTSVYMKTACLPIRYRIFSSGQSGILKQICSTVISEGGYVNTSQTKAIGNDLDGVNLSQLVYRPLVSLRLKSTHIDAIAVPDSFDVYGLQQAAFKWRVVLNPTLGGESWTSAGDDSCMEYDTSANSMSGGTVLGEGIFVGSNKGGTISIKKDLADFTLQLGRTIDGVSDIICLAAIATTNNDDAIGSIVWQEHN